MRDTAKSLYGTPFILSRVVVDSEPVLETLGAGPVALVFLQQNQVNTGIVCCHGMRPKQIWPCGKIWSCDHGCCLNLSGMLI